MPSATASWLVDNSSLSFRQIADFCGLHVLEVQAIADETASTKLTGRDPIRAGELTHEEIEKGQADENYDLKMHKAPDPMTRTKGPRYTPVSKRQDKPDGIAWIIKNHPEVSDGAISKLIGTTRNTIGNIRDRTHWNMANIQPKDPVTLGLTTQRELDAAVAKAQKEAGTTAEVTDANLAHDRDALINELRKEREQAAADAEAALKAEEEGEDTRPEIVPGIKDPFAR
ncbi:cell cycle transcriptional regulator TrcR [Sphingomicrobium aestuariivivum]|uniref:cell cycle transcriptional regulator TrcR n=1 Tax=Sphingomicrobium aestuariivivum TaxID=1582356 RepID=UPI0035E3DA18